MIIAVREKEFKHQKVIERTSNSLLGLLGGESSNFKTSTIINNSTASGYLNGKINDISYINYQGELYLLIGSEEKESRFITYDNRVYGLARLKDGQWTHDKKSPNILNPIGYEYRFPEFIWATDHLGGFVSPIIKDDDLYIFMSFGTDNPVYDLTGIKVKL
jgi:hypothetical protein